MPVTCLTPGLPMENSGGRSGCGMGGCDKGGGDKMGLIEPTIPSGVPVVTDAKLASLGGDGLLVSKGAPAA